MIPVLNVHLDHPPEQRWAFLRPEAPKIRAMFAEYLRDLESVASQATAALPEIRSLLTSDEWSELEGLAGTLDLPLPDVILGNLYYDALKHLWGCTAFAVDSPDGPIHARNLDWFSEDGSLARSSVLFRFLRGGQVQYSTVGWPGFVGCLSGMAPGRFAVTLSSVWSDDPAVLRTPMGFLMRRVLDSPCT